MDDRQLLEAAAKAAGYKVRWHSESYYGPTMEIMEDESGGPQWNPLTDDGDALRLAVKLRLLRGGYEFHHYQALELCLTDADPYAATRRAIVRAAAEIGKGMP